MYEFWHDHFKPKYQNNAKFCCIDIDRFIIHIKTEDFYKDVADDVQNWFDTSNYSEDDKKPLPIGKNKKVIGLMKDELGGKVMKEFCGLRAKMIAKRKKAKGTTKCVTKRKLMFENYKDCLFYNTVILITQQSDHHKCTQK